MKDYYKILNIKKNATEEEIKKSYRMMAQKYHPDKNNNSTNEIFCDINEAYSVLSNLKERAKYDLKLNEKDINIENILNKNIFRKFDFFGKKQDNVYKSVNLKIYLTEGIKNKVIRITKKEKCKSCKGSGKIKVESCSKCRGTGRVSALYSRDGSVRSDSCINCLGEGSVSYGICRSCNGKKEIEVVEEYKVKIEVYKK